MVHQRTGDLLAVVLRRRQPKIGPRPHVVAQHGQGVADGGQGFGLPRGAADGAGLLAQQAVGQQGDEGEEPAEGRRSAGDRFVTPRARRLDAQVGAALFRGDLHPPAPDEPTKDVRRRSAGVRTQEGRRVEGALGITHEDPAEGDGRLAAVIPHGALRGDLHSTVRSPWPYQSGTTRGVHTVAGAAATSWRVGRRWPLRRGRPPWCGARGGAGS